VKEKKAEDIVKEEFVVPPHLVIVPTDTEEVSVQIVNFP